LLHLRLPDISGVEVLRRLQPRRIPVVVLNADATSGQKRLLADGAREFLTKPLDVKQLLRSSTSCSSMRS
jgi:CheY-like chemotaxis protein